MTSRYTPALHLEVPARGDYLNTWDLVANPNYDLIDAAAGGLMSISAATIISGGGTLFLTTAQAAAQILQITGSLTQDIWIVYPASSGGRKLFINGVSAMNGHAIRIFGNNRSDTIGIYFDTAFGIPLPFVVTPWRVYWDYGAGHPAQLMDFPTSFKPNGWLACDGTWYSTTQYDLLFDLIGYNYGGNNSTAFAVPEFRGYTTVTADNFSSAGSAGRFFNWGVGAAGGELQHVLSAAEMPNHGHGVTDPQHTHATSQTQHVHGGVIVGYGAGGNFAAGAGWSLTTGQTSPNFGSITVSYSATGIGIHNAGGGGAHNNVQPSKATARYIRF